MGFLNRKPTALAMLGSLENVRQLIKLFDSNGINLVEKDYVTVDELLEGIRENKNVEYILISDNALTGIDDGKYEVIKEIRKGYEDIFIALFFNFQKPDDKYRNWAFGYGVYNLYYPDSNGSFNFKNIIPELLEKSMPVKQGQVKVIEYESQSKQEEINSLKAIIDELTEKQKLALNDNDREAQSKIEEEVSLYKGQISGLENDKEVLEQKLNDIRKEQDLVIEKAVREAESKAQEEVEKLKIIVKQIEKPNSNALKMKGNITIGVFNVSSGAGSTSACINIAESFAKDGYRCAVIAFDGKPDLRYKKRGRADYIVPFSVPGDKKIRLLEAIKRDYQFIILDFGNLFNISPIGQIETGRLADRAEDIEEFLRCQYKIGVGFSDEWHIGKLNYFIDNDVFENTNTCIFSIEGIEGSKTIDKIDLNICERNSNVLIDVLYEWIGLRRQEKVEKAKRTKLFGRNSEED